jgi:hypothetical protein
MTTLGIRSLASRRNIGGGPETRRYVFDLLKPGPHIGMLEMSEDILFPT